MATKDTGDIYEDMVQNVVEVLHNNKIPLGLKDIHDTELASISRCPCATVEFDSATEEWVRMPNRKKITVTLAVTYYHEELNESTRKKEIRKQLSKLADVLRKNWDVNGYCTNHGSNVGSTTAYVIVPPSGQWMAGGRVMLTCMKEITVTLVGT